MTSENDSVCNLGMPVGLSVLHRCEVMLEKEINHQFPKVFICELCDVVGDDYFWNAIPDPDGFFKELHGVFGCNLQTGVRLSIHFVKETTATIRYFV